MRAFNKLKIVGVLGLIALTAISCTQDRPYKKVTLFDVQSRSGITQGVDHLMLVSNAGLDMEAPAIAYEQAQAELVQFVYSEHSLDVIKVPEDGKFIGNDKNSKLMVSIPVSYIDTKCTEDAFGECTNVEQINEDIPWNKKGFFKPEFKDVTTPGLLSLSVTMDNYFQGSCHAEQSSKLKSYKIEPGVVNFVVEKTYRTNARCASSLSRLDQVTFTVDRFYSIVALDKLTTPGYTALTFKTDEEENQYGFFRTYSKKLDNSNQDTLEGNIEFQNRWAPGKTVVYYMNDEFNQVDDLSPELNNKIKKATYHAFATINEALKEADASIKLELREPDPSVKVGDLRYNHLIMVHDPITRGLLGYGPSTTNPHNGEIVNARTVMYKGIMKKTIKGAYDDLIKRKLGELKTSTASAANPSPSSSSESTSASQQAEALLGQALSSAENQSLKIVENLLTLNQEKALSQQLVSQIPFIDAENLAHRHQKYNSLSQSIFHQDQTSIFNQPEHLKEFFEREKRASLVEVYSQRNFYSADLFNTHSVVEQELDKLVEEFGGLKTWTQLTAGQKQKAIDVILPFVWVPTLVHELGHNLGLRHNFHGSFDKDNHYTAAELAHRGIHRNLEYSSIMDYAYGTQNELNIMGKYDIAAFRYAYGKVNSFVRDGENRISLDDAGKAITQTTIGAVEMVEPDGTGGFIPGTERLVAVGSYDFDSLKARGLILKPYKFCTDENVGVMATCNRFDEGTTRQEIVAHYKKAWDEGYERRNQRNDRYNFNNFDGDIGHIRYLMRSMDSLRQAFELYETVARTNGIDVDDERWKTNDFLKDIKAAAIDSGRFLLEILKTPDVHCQIKDLTQPGGEALVLPLRAISKYNSSCYNLSLPPQYKVVGQAGKSLRSIKDIDNPDASVIQIDTRGIWLDKLMALMTLVEKDYSSIEEHHGNFTNIPELKGEISETLTNILMDTHTGELTFDNGTKTGARAYSLVDDDSNRLKAPLHIGIRYFFNLPGHTISFQEAMNNVIARYAPPIEESAVGNAFYSEFQVYRNDVPSEFREGSDKMVVGGDVYAATKANTNAIKLMKYIKEVPKVKKAIADFLEPPTKLFEEEAKAACEPDSIEEPEMTEVGREACIQEYVTAQTEAFNQARPNEMIMVVLMRSMNPSAQPEESADEATKALYEADFEVLLAEIQQQTKDIEYYKSMLATLNTTW